MKRFGLGVLAIALIGVASSCIPAPTPPPFYVAPVIESVVSTPPQAQPGHDVTLAISASDDQVISSIFVWNLIVPSGSILPGAPPCTSTISNGDNPTPAVIKLTCSLPTYASNGTWYAEVTIYDDAGGGYGYQGLKTRVPFEVTGGSDDRSAPGLVSYSTNPTVLHPDTPFTLTLRLIDDSPAQLVNNSSLSFFKLFDTYGSVIGCHNPQYTPVSPTLIDVTLTCTHAPETTQYGWHHAPIDVVDALGQKGTVDAYIEIV